MPFFTLQVPAPEGNGLSRFQALLTGPGKRPQIRFLACLAGNDFLCFQQSQVMQNYGVAQRTFLRQFSRSGVTSFKLPQKPSPCNKPFANIPSFRQVCIWVKDGSCQGNQEYL
jgi:hypothetical protein